MPRMWDRESRAYKWIEPTARQKRDKISQNIVKLGRGKCWEWTGSTTEFGYGAIYWEGKQRVAHRMAFEAWKKTIPEGMLVCHKCDNPKCVNPSHLFLGTHQDNAADRNSKGRQAKGEKHGRWKHGLRSRLNPPQPKGRRRKISSEAAEEIRKSAGPANIIASRYGVSPNYVYRLRAGSR